MHPLLRLAPLFRPRLPLLAACVLALLGATGLGLAGPWLVAHAIDADIASGDVAGLSRTALLYLGVVAGNLALTWSGRVGAEVVAQDAMMRLKRRLFRHLLRHDLAFHDEHPPGRLITRVQGDSGSLRVLFTEVLVSLPADLALLVGMFVVLGHSAPQVGRMVAWVLPPYALLFAVFRKVAPPRFLAVRKVHARLTGFFSGMLQAMPTLQLFDRRGWAVQRAEQVNAEVYRREFRAFVVPVAYHNAIFLVRSVGFAALLWLGGRQVARGTLTVGALVMGLGYLRQLFNPLMRLSFHITTVERARASARRIGELLDRAPLIAGEQGETPWPGLRRAIRIEGVGFHYLPGSPVLEDVDIEIPAGSHVGVVGATGSGKSTLVNLLMRFRDPTTGRVTIDGVDLREIRLDELRRHVGLVLQDVLLLPGTVLDNLGGAPGPARRALDLLGLDLGLQDRVAVGGANLSHGERQLLTFARALVDDPEVLVLDEATSAVDPATEARIQAALGRIEHGRTTITVAHRLATVRGCDQVLVLSRGRVVERGTHQELLSRGGVYATLHQLQQGSAA